RPDPGRGLQLRHPQARRRVRRRHQPPARDDLRRARQGPPERGPDRHDPAFIDEDLALTVEDKLGAGHDSPGEGINDLMTELGRMGIGPDRVTAQELLELGSNTEITEHLQHLADQLLEEKEQEVGPEAWAQIERFVLLRTIDTLWVEHLTELDDMRRG